jgi:hypothetical protein
MKALEDMGFKRNMLKVSETAQKLEGYQGDLRDQTAEIIIPRYHVGGAANDIGFKLQEDGTWGAIISDYDRGNRAADHKSAHAKGCNGYSEKWLKKLYQRYSYHKVKESLSSQGFVISEETEENGEILINVDTTGYGG